MVMPRVRTMAATRTAARRRPAQKAKAKARASQDIFDLIGRTESINQASAAMQAIAHPVRLKILCLINSAELSVLEIVDAVGTSQSNISQHLAVLRDNGILAARKDANKVYYRVSDPRVLQMISLTRQIFCTF